MQFKRSTLILFIFSLTCVSAEAEVYPVLASYETLARDLTEKARVAKTQEQLNELRTQTQELVKLGVEMMQLYQTKMPACTEQYKVIVEELKGIECQSLGEIDTRYHDGKGLPPAPKYCYLGRSQVVHPIMNIVRIKSVYGEEARGDTVKEFEEVVEHVARIQTKLDDPPQ